MGHAAEVLPAPTRDDLARLLKAKDEAQAGFSAAARACREGAEKGLDVAERVALDLSQETALLTSCAADRAYSEAVKAHLAAYAVAA